MGCEAAPNPSTSVHQTDRIRRFCCRFPADRGTSHAPTPFGQNQKRRARATFKQGLCAPRSRFCAERVGVRLADDGLRSGPNPGTSVYQTDRIRRFYCRFPADRGTSHAPTPFGQNQKRRARATFKQGFCAPRSRFCAERVGALRGYEGSDGLRSGPRSRRLGVSDKPHSPVLLPVPGRSRDKPRPYALRAESKASRASDV